jgi:hypothetical protein
LRYVVTVNASLDGTTHRLGKRQLSYFEEDRIRGLPGARSASATEFIRLALCRNVLIGWASV